MTFRIDEALEVLERTPAVIGSLLRGTSPAWHGVNEGPDTWTAVEVVGHLVHAEETNWIPRAQLILDGGERRSFPPFDRGAHLTRYARQPLDRLLDRFAELRGKNLTRVCGWELTERELSSTGRHPELGTVTLQHLLATWVAHDLGHIGQIVRVMAKRYSEEVGGWRGYLSILKR